MYTDRIRELSADFPSVRTVLVHAISEMKQESETRYQRTLSYEDDRRYSFLLGDIGNIFSMTEFE